MIRHQDVPAKTKVQLPPRFLQSADEQRELIPGERGAIFAKIDRDEENPASDEQALHSGHSRSVVARNPGCNAKTHGTENVPWLQRPTA